MTREFEPDPEAEADRMRRESAPLPSSIEQHENPDRKLVALYSWRRPEITGQWRCRRPGCSGSIPITADAMEMLATCNDELRRRGEPRLNHAEPVVAKERAAACSYCPGCRAEYERTLPARRRAHMDRIAVKIRELKESSDPAGQRDVILQLREWGHPDVDGLVAAIQERNRSTGNKPRRQL